VVGIHLPELLELRVLLLGVAVDQYEMGLGAYEIGALRQRLFARRLAQGLAGKKPECGSIPRRANLNRRLYQLPPRVTRKLSVEFT